MSTQKSTGSKPWLRLSGAIDERLLATLVGIDHCLKTSPRTPSHVVGHHRFIVGKWSV
jgi:hypothetical protein